MLPCRVRTSHTTTLTFLEYLVGVGSSLAVAPAHLVDLFGRVCPGLQGDGEGAAVVDPAVVTCTTEPGARERERRGGGGGGGGEQ